MAIMNNTSNDNSSKSLLEAALSYVNRGWQVFPVYEILPNGRCACGRSDCRSPGKHPRTTNGLRDGTTNAEQIKKWWSEHPLSNIGIKTGAESGFLVLDVDERNAGLESLTKLEGQYGKLPTNAVVLTGGNGIHFYFKYPGLTIKSKSGALGQGSPGIDVKADGGYVVAPPSNHSSGKCYETDGLGEVPDVPSWLLNLLKNGRTSLIETGLDKIIVGNRNVTLTSLAGKYHSMGFSHETIVKKLLADNASLCVPPLTEKEVIGIVDSISRYPHSSGGTAHPIIIPANEIEPQDISWLWPHRIPIKKITFLVGPPGDGKSTLCLFIASTVSRGRPWPDQSGFANPAGRVIILTAEDGLSDTANPRLMKFDADLTKIAFIDGVRERDGSENWFNIISHLPALEEAVTNETRLIIIDPISAYMGFLDSNMNTKVRAVLAPLAQLADRHNVAILCISHLNKNANTNALYRTLGSVAFVALARAVWLFANDPADRNRKLFLPVKYNLGMMPPGLAMRITDQGLIFEDLDVELTADEVLAKQGSVRATPAKDRAVQFLRDKLIEAKGEMKSDELKHLASQAGITDYAYNTASEELGLTHEKIGNDSDAYWVTRLPPEMTCDTIEV